MNFCKTNFRLCLLISALLLSACGGGGGGGSEEKYSISNRTLNFTTTIDGATPAAQQVVFKATTAQNEYPGIIWGGDFLTAVDDEYPDDHTLTLTVHVDQPLNLGVGTHTTTIEVYNSEYDVFITVNYIINPPPPGDPTVSSVSPYAEVSGQAQEVVIGGSGFSRFTDSNPPQVSFNGTAATSVTLVSDTEIRAVHPALSAGVYPVQVNGADVAFTSTANLKVFDYPQFSSYATSSAGVKSKPVFDVERSALYVANKGLGQIERYRYADNAWTMDSLSIPSLQDITLTADGSQLIAVDGNNFLKVDISGDTLNETNATPVDFGYANYTQLEHVFFTGTGKIVSSGGTQWVEIYLYDPDNDTYQTLNDLSYSHYSSIYTPTMWGSWDGSRFFLAESGISTTRNYLVDVGTLAVWETPLSGSYTTHWDFASDRAGDINVLDAAKVYDGDFNFLADLAETGTVAAVSPDGTTVYVYNQSNGAIRMMTGFTDVVGSVSGTNVITDTPGTNPVITLSLDGKTLFFADSNKVIILPVSDLSN